MNTRLKNEQIRETHFVRRTALMSALYMSIALLAIGGAGFRLWPSTLFNMVFLGYICSLIFAYAMSIFFYVHMEKRPILVNDALINIENLKGPEITAQAGESGLESLDLPPESAGQ